MNVATQELYVLNLLPIETTDLLNEQTSEPCTMMLKRNLLAAV